MSQINSSVSGKITKAPESEFIDQRIEPSQFDTIRENYGGFAVISLIFGVTMTFLFYDAGFGLNSFLFTIIMVGLLVAVSRKLKLSISREIILCYVGTVLLGLSSMLTASDKLQLLNILGSLFLLDISLLLQFQEAKRWDFTGYIKRFLLLPLRSLTSIGMPFLDGNRFFKNTKALKNDTVRNTLFGLLLSIPLLLIIIALLSRADLLFGRITRGAYEVLFSGDLFTIILMILIGFLACFSIIYGAVSQGASQQKARDKSNPVAAITVTSLLLAVYVFFCAIQVIYLFAGGSFGLPAEFTYSEYARRGFFELLAVTCINILIILFCINVFQENRPLRYILTAITACTYVMIGSSAYRMFLYIGEYHLTFLRIFVLLFLFIDALLLAGIIISLYRKDFPLFGYCTMVIAICYLLFSFSRPDTYIASYYINHTDEAETDPGFLMEELSYDAAKAVLPVLLNIYDKLPEGEIRYDNYENITVYSKHDIRRYYNDIVDRREANGIRGFNLSIYLAEINLERHPINWE